MNRRADGPINGGFHNPRVQNLQILSYSNGNAIFGLPRIILPGERIGIWGWVFLFWGSLLRSWGKSPRDEVFAVLQSGADTDKREVFHFCRAFWNVD